MSSSDVSAAAVIGAKYVDRKSTWSREREQFRRSVSPLEVHKALTALGIDMKWVLQQFKEMGEGRTPSPLRLAAVRGILDLMASGGQVKKLQAIKAAKKVPSAGKAADDNGKEEESDPLACVEAAVMQAKELENGSRD